MRVLLVGIAVLGLAGQAAAADMPWLRGSAIDGPAPGFAGFYAGIQGGAAIGNTDFSSTNDHNRMSGVIAGMLMNSSETAVVQNEQHPSDLIRLSKVNTTGQHYGGFVGYNSPWEEGVLGIELNYSRTSLDMTSGGAFRDVFVTSDKFSNTLALSATSTVLLQDYLTLRARAGWQLGCFLPYAFAGLAVARADISHSASAIMTSVDVTPPQVPPVPPRPTFTSGPLTASDLKSDAYGYGVAVGLGVDVLLGSNFFLRAEWEYVGLQKIADENVNISAVRAAVGVKF